MDIAIIKNYSREGPGSLETLFKRYGLSFRIFDLDRGDDFPDPLEYRALVVLGGPDSANDSSKKMQDELTQIRKALKHNIPYFGICLGLQTLVKAAGGTITRSPIKEVGFKDQNGRYFMLEKERDDPLLKGMAFPRPIFHLHGETVILRKGMQLLASGKWCKNQLVKVQKNAYGIQGHMELTEKMLRQWLLKDPDLKQLDKKHLLADYWTIQKGYEETGTQLFTNFLRIAKVI